MCCLGSDCASLLLLSFYRSHRALCALCALRFLSCVWLWLCNADLILLHLPSKPPPTKTPSPLVTSCCASTLTNLFNYDYDYDYRLYPYLCCVVYSRCPLPQILIRVAVLPLTT
jgi:hypothetical protein